MYNENNILGSGGVVAPPVATCQCRICKEAREKGIPYARTGCSMFVYDANLLFDTPEEIRMQLNRENIRKVENVILTHWHPDHTLGLRILELLNFDFFNEKSIGKPINVYMSKEQLEMFKKLSCGGFLDFYEKNRKCIKIIEIGDGIEIDFGKIKVTPVKFKESDGFYFIVEDDKGKVIYAPCEFKGFEINEKAKNVNVLIAHHLYSEDLKLTGKQWMKEEDSFEHMIKQANTGKIKKIIITHIEEIFKKSHDELNDLAKTKYKDYNIEFSFDGMIIEI
jgi:phosphoribosyl 1,2-cyclic phosphate phosphodiesterase